MARTENVRQLANFIWSVADLLRGDYKQADYGKVILPFTVLRRLDCVLEPTKETVMDFYEKKVKPMMQGYFILNNNLSVLRPKPASR
ncbi:MAG: type I restriction-modification system subunit M N-terminal domain-containing protein [Pegethrix bostrychoides GSE-TBD4-15B]|jgi:type I restriction enzyme M protein|uniref:Type I restriction-modification system subunit M N-terminal domain-containing protein n=1 Tax=Pegethrix bostrychoides GSE-TBD4-15B TaxID=2839662 RepID=A0A951U640_9CYAN|nr:type I restriction-modification system subunit M N-terminal domain-containing protein [Pegethrix bostrychoides GSE-TBD4-15B]